MVTGYCYGFVHSLFKCFFQDSFVVPPKASNQTSIPLVVQAVAISVILLLFTVNWQSIGSRFTCATGVPFFKTDFTRQLVFCGHT